MADGKRQTDPLQKIPLFSFFDAQPVFCVKQRFTYTSIVQKNDFCKMSTNMCCLDES